MTYYPTNYQSNKKYVVQWYDGDIEVTDGWNLNAIRHRDNKKGYCSLNVLREATEEDIKIYKTN